MELDEVIICDSNAEKIIEAIEAHISSGAEPKTDLENMVKRLYNIESFAEYIYTRNKLIEYIQSVYVV